MGRATQSFQYFGFVFPDIDKANKLAKRKCELEHAVVSPDMMSELVQTDPEYAETTNLAQPILFATVVIADQKIRLLIDGHHRLRKALDEKIAVLPCYTLDVKQTLEVMAMNMTAAAMRANAKKLKFI